MDGNNKQKIGHYLQEIESILHTLEKKKLGDDYYPLNEKSSKQHYEKALQALSSYENNISSLENKLKEPPEGLSKELRQSFRTLRQELRPFVSKIRAMKKVYQDKIGVEPEKQPSTPPFMSEPENPEARLVPLEEPELPPAVQQKMKQQAKPDSGLEPTQTSQDIPPAIFAPDEPMGQRKKTKQSPRDVIKNIYAPQIKKLNASIKQEKEKIETLKNELPNVSASDKKEIEKEIDGRQKIINKHKKQIENFKEKRKQVIDRLTEVVKKLQENLPRPELPPVPIDPPEIDRDKMIDEPELPPAVQQKIKRQKEKRQKEKEKRQKIKRQKEKEKTKSVRSHNPEITKNQRPSKKEQRVLKLTESLFQGINHYLLNKT